MHFYNFHIKDYRAKTAHLTPLEHYIYRTLIDWYYLNEKPFETIEQIARYLLLPLTDDNKMAIGNVLGEFFHYHKGKYHHKRINSEIKNYRHKNSNDTVTDSNAESNDTVTDSNAESNDTVTADVTLSNAKRNAKSNGNPLSQAERTKRYRERQRMLKALLNKGVAVDDNAGFDEIVTLYNAHCVTHDNDTVTESVTASVTQSNGKNEERTINHKPLTNNHDISPQTPQRLNVAFDDFWDLYDKKQDRPKCERLWAKLKDQERLDIMAYIPNYKLSQPDKQYRKNPQTFLNNRSWENEIIFEKAVNHEPHPNSTEAYAIRLSSDIEALKRDLYPEKYA